MRVFRFARIHTEFSRHVAPPPPCGDTNKRQNMSDLGAISVATLFFLASISGTSLITNPVYANDSCNSLLAINITTAALGLLFSLIALGTYWIWAGQLPLWVKGYSKRCLQPLALLFHISAMAGLLVLVTVDRECFGEAPVLAGWAIVGLVPGVVFVGMVFVFWCLWGPSSVVAALNNQRDYM